MIGFLKSTPIEHVETETPLVVRRHELVPDRFGHGKYRGGASIAIELECHAVEARITVRGLDRFRFQPWGVFGGGSGTNCVTTLNPGREARNIGRIKVLTLAEGDLLRMVSSSGGGFGPPTERDPSAVLRDVLDGMLDIQAAREIYGVVIRDRAVDGAATDALRSALAKPSEGFSVRHGPARQQYEKSWPVERSVALANRVLAAPPGLRRKVMADGKREVTI
jgi:N-methylhydantoinase B